MDDSFYMNTCEEPCGFINKQFEILEHMNLLTSGEQDNSSQSMEPLFGYSSWPCLIYNISVPVNVAPFLGGFHTCLIFSLVALEVVFPLGAVCAGRCECAPKVDQRSEAMSSRWSRSPFKRTLKQFVCGENVISFSQTHLLEELHISALNQLP